MHPNLLLAWALFLLGIGSGALLGLGFHRDGFLGGYDAFRRRLFRLGHISFFGLGAVNALFALTAMGVGAGLEGVWLIASVALGVGAVTMPLCCGVVGVRPRMKNIFVVPVLATAVGCGATVLGGLAS
ncbi:MAG: hypothetical protein R3B46_00675 [Phycisphaerales bacterium]|nr:hypothetical protein [Phycisphaerales bacterium]